ncbi:MAG: hypothetical protein GF355_03700, partial [Candidatus Eisenbacteria bacterium]|nr:hypothetical protein [Candidatus Eisenbacteria bacterium]
MAPSAKWRWIVVTLFAGGFLAVYLPGVFISHRLAQERRREEARLQEVLLQNLLGNRGLSLAARVAALEGDQVLRAAPCDAASGAGAWRDWLRLLGRRTGADEVRVADRDGDLIASLQFPEAFGLRLPPARASGITGLAVAAWDPQAGMVAPLWRHALPLPECPWLSVVWIWRWDETLGAAEVVAGRSLEREEQASGTAGGVGERKDGTTADTGAGLHRAAAAGRGSGGAVLIASTDGAPLLAVRPAGAPARVDRWVESPFIRMIPASLGGGLLVALIGWLLLLPLRRAWQRLERETEEAWERTRGLQHAFENGNGAHAGSGASTAEVIERASRPGSLSGESSAIGSSEGGRPPAPELLLRALSEEALQLAARAERMAEVAGWKDVGRALGHDIRNALTPLRLTVGTLALRARDPELEPALQSAQTALGRVQHLVEEFSNFARLPDGVRRVIDLNAAARDVVAQWPAGDRPPVELNSS